MARILRSTRTGRRKAAALGTLATAAMTVMAVAAGSTAAGAGTTSSIQASAQAKGLVITVFGKTLTGGQAQAQVDTSVPSASAKGIGTLLTDHETDASATGTDSNDTKAQTCTVGTPSSVPLVSLGVACSDAAAVIDGSGDATAKADGTTAQLTVNANSVLNTLLGKIPTDSGSSDPCASGSSVNSLFGAVCTLADQLGSKATETNTLVQAVDGALQNLSDIITKATSIPTLVVKVGAASADITTTGDTATATATGETLEIQVLPGVGCDVGTILSAGCTTPVVDIQVGPATSTSTFDGTKWTPENDGSVVTITICLPGLGCQTPIHVAPGIDQTILSGT
ncbi:MAG TPA: hypothetical protein VEI83_01345, partial [Acidimicrobiales bacterium]|nr:hypothetical protein [Acidimicrobiales bacterium]